METSHSQFGIQSEADICHLIERDEWMMKVLKEVQALQLPDWWIGAGFVRNKVWDTLHGFQHRTPLGDIDVIYFNPEKMEESDEERFQSTLAAWMPDQSWSVTNQARMGAIYQDGPYTSSIDALSKWPETATCVATKIDDQDKGQLAAPLGVADLIGLTVRPSPSFIGRFDRIIERQRQKKWREKWPKLLFEID